VKLGFMNTYCRYALVGHVVTAAALNLVGTGNAISDSDALVPPESVPSRSTYQSVRRIPRAGVCRLVERGLGSGSSLRQSSSLLSRGAPGGQKSSIRFDEFGLNCFVVHFPCLLQARERPGNKSQRVGRAARGVRALNYGAGTICGQGML
jgi:hypothetical protein